MKPIEALENKNWETVLLHQKKYQKEFGSPKTYEQHKLGDIVFIRAETRRTKQDKLFKTKGKIIAIEKPNVYKLENERGKIIIRHYKQLKRTPEAKDVVPVT